MNTFWTLFIYVIYSFILNVIYPVIYLFIAICIYNFIHSLRSFIHKWIILHKIYPTTSKRELRERSKFHTWGCLFLKHNYYHYISCCLPKKTKNTKVSEWSNDVETEEQNKQREEEVKVVGLNPDPQERKPPFLFLWGEKLFILSSTFSSSCSCDLKIWNLTFPEVIFK